MYAFAISDIGGNFDGETTLMYVFDEEILTPTMLSNIAVRMAFSTDVQTSSFQVLLFMLFGEE